MILPILPYTTPPQQHTRASRQTSKADYRFSPPQARTSMRVSHPTLTLTMSAAISRGIPTSVSYTCYGPHRENR